MAIMDKYDILSIIAPVAAPAAPATMLVNILYSDLTRESVSNTFALGAAIFSGIGAEASGMIAAYVGIQAYRKQKYGLMFVAIASFIVYATFMAVGISSARNPMTMVSTIVISIIAYLAVGLLTDIRGITSEANTDANRQIALMEAERKLTNAQTRQAKTQYTGVSRVMDSEHPAGRYTQNSAKVKRVIEYWQAHPTASMRDVAKACDCSPSTAMRYKPEVPK